mmetsp:Transcript_104267/g.232779  ORF Transcript_104267/g.232779 Transcript_104267/m.232779 type:complete len:296 (-) Transcript_104267:88-975(-)
MSRRRHGRPQKGSDRSQQARRPLLPAATCTALAKARGEPSQVSPRSQARTPCVARCVQCRRPQSAQCVLAHAHVLHRSIFSPECVHGPFCERCRRAISERVLPACICKALIDAWDDERPPARVVAPEGSSGSPGPEGSLGEAPPPSAACAAPLVEPRRDLTAGSLLEAAETEPQPPPPKRARVEPVEPAEPAEPAELAELAEPEAGAGGSSGAGARGSSKVAKEVLAPPPLRGAIVRRPPLRPRRHLASLRRLARSARGLRRRAAGLPPLRRPGSSIRLRARRRYAHAAFSMLRS